MKYAYECLVTIITAVLFTCVTLYTNGSPLGSVKLLFIVLVDDITSVVMSRGVRAGRG